VCATLSSLATCALTKLSILGVGGTQPSVLGVTFVGWADGWVGKKVRVTVRVRATSTQ
jgi:hypothetical protein